MLKLCKKCPFCGKKVEAPHTRYCVICAHFAFRIMNTRLLPRAIKGIRNYVRRYGFICYYTGIALEMSDVHSPWYCVFDHWKPQDQRKVVITCALINNMKSQLMETEFWAIIRRLAGYRRQGAKFRKIKLRYWNRQYTLEDEEGVFATGPCTKKCDLCGKKITIYNSKYCPVCARFVARLHSKELPAATMEETLDYIRKNGFKCHYTGMRLELNDSSSPWYCVFDHWIPHHPQKIVVTSALINQMKSDLSEDEFWYYVLQFADYKRKHKKVRKRKPVYWYRLCCSDDYKSAAGVLK